MIDTYCPLTAHHGCLKACRGGLCTFWSDELESCLIRLALMKYVKGE